MTVCGWTIRFSDKNYGVRARRQNGTIFDLQQIGVVSSIATRMTVESVEIQARVVV
jgi:hypothetical protein